MAGLDPLTAILNLGQSIIDRVIPDKTQAATAKAALLTAELQGDIQETLAQLEVDKTEAASNSKFVAGWRPYIGWVCGTGIAVDVIVRPMFAFFASAFAHHVVSLPALDLSTLMPLLAGMLGFGAMRSFDKAQGTGNGT